MALGLTDAIGAGRSRRRRVGKGGSWFYPVMTALSVLWLLPAAFIVVISLRSTDDITTNGLSALPHSLSLDSFVYLFTQAGFARALANSLLVTVTGVVLSLVLGATSAFALSRFRIPFRIPILLLMLCGNLLPPQILLIPVEQICEALGIYNTLLALILAQVGFGVGFYTFVLHGFLRNIPDEIFEAARVDGATPVRVFLSVALPLTKPALAALAALASTWIFNDLIWSLTLIRSQVEFPVTLVVLQLQGSYVGQWNVVAAAALIGAIPPAVVFFVFQKQFISGLMVGSSK